MSSFFFFFFVIMYTKEEYLTLFVLALVFNSWKSIAYFLTSDVSSLLWSVIVKLIFNFCPACSKLLSYAASYLTSADGFAD